MLSFLVSPVVQWLGRSPTHFCVLGSSPGMPYLLPSSGLLYFATLAALQSVPAPIDQEHDQHGFQIAYDSNGSMSLAQCSLLPVHDYDDIALVLSHWVSAPIVQWLGRSHVHHCVPGSSPDISNFDTFIWITVSS